MIDPDEAERRSRAVIAEVRKQFSELQLVVAVDDTAGRLYCAGGVARALALYDSIVLLEENGRADVAGVLGRIVLEVHHTALYALFGGVEAIQALEADLGHYIKLIADENADVWGEPASDKMREHAATFGTPKELSFKRLRKRLQALLNDSDAPVDLTTWYTMFYRGESTFSVHGIGQLQRYINFGQAQIVLDPPPLIVQGVSYAATVTEIVGHLMWWLLRKNGGDSGTLGELRNALQEVLVE